MTGLILENVEKFYGSACAVQNVNLHLPEGKLVCFLGPSGCGKTTLLRIIAGLETPDQGNIVFHGEDVSGHDVRDRNVGFVFQHYALFRHMTVFENVAFGLRIKPRKQRLPEAQIRQRVHELLELVQLVWGRSTVPYGLPEQLQGPLFTLYGTQFPKSRSFVMLVALLMLVSVWLLLTRTRIGLVIQAALKYPEMVEALGHNVPRVFMLVFGGGAALAGLAGVIGGNTYVTEPAMAASVGSIIFVVVVVGGMGSLAGAFLASLLIGLVQTFAVALDYSLIHVFKAVGVAVTDQTFGYPLLKLTISQVAPILPYLFLVLILIFRPKGLLGTRED